MNPLLRRSLLLVLIGVSAFGQKPAPPKVVFVCEHGAAKSVIAAAEFKRLAKEKGLAVEVIHVHHEDPLCEADGEREFDPVATMKPVCPNCHCIIHSKTPPFSIDEVRQMLNRKP